MNGNKCEKGSSSSLAVKAGVWYTICNFLFKGMAFITTPIFTRLLTKAEVGSFSNMASWISILTVITAFDLQTSIIRSKLEHEGDMDSYIFSILSFTSFTTAVVYLIVLVFPEESMNLFQMDMKYIHLMFLYLFVSPAYQMFITKQRAYYKYKMFVLMTGISIIVSTIFSLGMVLIVNDKLLGRYFGYYIPQIIMALLIYIYIVLKGKKVKIKYWKYATKICLPLVPHVLSLYLLSSSDKIIITNLCGAEYTALYSIAYSCYHIVTILFDSMNKAWAPWLLESLHYEKYDEIKKLSKWYISIFLALVIGVLLCVPEIIMILGGPQYKEAMYCLPALISSCVFQFIYTMYVNIEFYEKKTIGVAAVTMVATLINIVLNLILIPLNLEKGYIIAAYTTLIGYIILFIMHYVLVKKMNMAFVYDIKFIIGGFLVTLIVSTVSNIMYSMNFLRYMIIIVYCIVMIYVVYQNKSLILKFLGKKE